MIRSDLLEDVSKISCIQYLSLQRLVDYEVKCISQDILEAKNSDDDTVVINIGIGNLTINFSDDNIKYRFSPLETLDSAIKNAIKNNKSYLIDDIEQSLLNKLNTTYKELF